MTKRNEGERRFQCDKEIMRIIGDHLGIPSATLTLDMHIANDLGADSLDQVELIITIEERFDIKIPAEEMMKIQRISDILAYIQKV